MLLIFNFVVTLVLATANPSSFDIKKENGTFKFNGKLVVRNIEQSIENADVQITKTDFGYDVVATFDTRISHFSMPILKYAGLAVKDAVQVIVATKAKAI